MGYLFKNVSVVSMDEERPEIELLDVLVEGKLITKVAPNIEKSAHKVLEGKNRVLMPGFINTHTHASMSIFRGVGDDLPLFTWLSERIWPLEEKLTKEDIKVGAKLAVAEMLLSGTTSFLDMYMEMPQIGDVCLETGIRGFLSRGTTSGDEETNKKSVTSIKELIEGYHGAKDGLLTVLLGPHAIYTNSKEFLQEQVALAHEYGVGVHIHVSETKEEVANCLKEHGLTPVQYLDSLGLLDTPYVVAAHCVCLDERDREIFKAKNIGVAHNPKSNLKLASGVAPITQYLGDGITVGLGTDGAASNNNLDMLESLQYATLLQKGFLEDPLAFKAYEALKCATIEGAKVLRVDQKLGKIKEGYEADLILFDLNQPYYHPLTNCLISHLAYSAKSSDIILTMVQGEILMQDRKLLTLDLEKTYQEVEETMERLLKK